MENTGQTVFIYYAKNNSSWQINVYEKIELPYT